MAEIVHMASPAGSTWCGIEFDTPEYWDSERTTVPKDVTCAWCQAHIRQLSARRHGKTAATLKNAYVDAANDVADEFYPKGDKRRGEFIRDAGVLYTKLEPLVFALFSRWQDPERLATSNIVDDIKGGEHDR